MLCSGLAYSDKKYRCPKNEQRYGRSIPLLARPKEFESPTFRLGGGRSILLSYGRIYQFWLKYFATNRPK